MKLGVLTSSYKHTAVEAREKLAVAEPLLPELIGLLKAKCNLKEAMVLSTCNRVEIFFVAENPLAAMDQVEAEFYSFLSVQAEPGDHFERLLGRDAIQHIFRVTSSLESMVLGEPQITGQMKNFFHLSVEAKGPGFLLNQILNRAFVTAKRVRNETDIAKYAVSISFAATELAKKIFEELEDKTILIIGAGEMAELAVAHLLKAGCSRLLVTNRTFSRAVALAEEFNGSAVRFEQMQQNLETADIIISSTGAKGFILDKALIQAAMKKRKRRPMFLIDIAVPRDIHPEINEVSNCYVYDIDDLQSVVDANLKERQKAAEFAQGIIEEELTNIDDWMATLEVVPAIRHFRESVLALAQEELDKGLGQLGELTAKQERAVRSMVNGLAYKLLHNPTVTLKSKAKEGEQAAQYVQALNELFDLSPQKQEKAKKVIPIK